MNTVADFDRLADAHHRATAIHSSTSRITGDPTYAAMLALGDAAIAPALKRLSEDRDSISMMLLLHDLTGASPVPDEDRGRVLRMVEAWLGWGREQGHLPQQDGGSGSTEDDGIELSDEAMVEIKAAHNVETAARKALLDAQRALRPLEQAAQSARRSLTETLGRHLDNENIFIGDQDCPESPIGICVYDDQEDPCLDSCLFCGNPDERL